MSKLTKPMILYTQQEIPFILTSNYERIWPVMLNAFNIEQLRINSRLYRFNNIITPYSMHIRNAVEEQIIKFGKWDGVNLSNSTPSDSWYIPVLYQPPFVATSQMILDSNWENKMIWKDKMIAKLELIKKTRKSHKKLLGVCLGDEIYWRLGKQKNSEKLIDLHAKISDFLITKIKEILGPETLIISNKFAEGGKFIIDNQNNKAFLEQLRKVDIVAINQYIPYRKATKYPELQERLELIKIITKRPVFLSETGLVDNIGSRRTLLHKGHFLDWRKFYRQPTTYPTTPEFLPKTAKTKHFRAIMQSVLAAKALGMAWHSIFNHDYNHGLMGWGFYEPRSHTLFKTELESFRQTIVAAKNQVFKPEIVY